METIELEFQGYTWDEYFYVISNKSGILVTYRGELDSEGAVKLDEIVHVDEADEFGTLYESKQFAEIRKNVGNKGRLFFSYAEMKNGGRAEVTNLLKHALIPNHYFEKEYPQINYTIKGACALFPQTI